MQEMESEKQDKEEVILVNQIYLNLVDNDDPVTPRISFSESSFANVKIKC